MITMGLDGAAREVLTREAFLLLVTSARAGRFLVKRVFTAATFLFEVEFSETECFFSDDEEEEAKRRLRVNILWKGKLRNPN